LSDTQVHSLVKNKDKVLCILCNQNLSIRTTKHDCFYRQKDKDISVHKSHK